jgi:hypothetical protein
VYSISSGFFPDADMLEKISGQTGGCYIDLATCSISNAVNMSGNARDILLRIIAGKNEAHIDQDLSYTVGGDLLLSGYFSGTDIKNVECWFGNNRSIHVKQPIAVTEEKYCNPSGIDRVRMLQLFEVYTKGYWYDVLDFGKKEAVVTTSTAFIVLERLEDYIKFNIMPPPELRSKCDTTQFIIGSDVRRKRYKEQSTGVGRRPDTHSLFGKRRHGRLVGKNRCKTRNGKCKRRIHG